MSWFDTLKFHPELRRLADGEKLKVIALGSEQQMKEMWDASNPDDIYEMRSGTHLEDYPIDEWFGVIVQQGDKYRLVARSGFAVRQGKDGKEYAYKGGTKVSVHGKKYGGTVRDKANEPIEGIPTIAGYLEGGKRWMTDNRPDQHEVIPDEVIAHFKEHYGEDWDIKKWMEILKVDIDFDKDIPHLGLFNIKYRWKTKELIDMLETGDFDAREIKINHHTIYYALKRKLKREPTDEELIEFVKRVIMHESGHAAHYDADDKVLDLPEEQLEYVASILEFPESAYIALKQYLTHPATYNPIQENERMSYIFGAKEYTRKKQPEIMRKLLRYVNLRAKSSKDKEKLLRIELAHRKKMPKYQRQNIPINLEQAKARYNSKFYPFLKKLRW